MKKKLSIKVIGCGGIGGCLLNVLPRYLNYQKDFKSVSLTIIDGDDYEVDNKNRQSFDSFGNKAEGTASRLKREFEKITFFGIPYFVNENNASVFLCENDVIFSCVDNHATRKLISDQCENLKNTVLFSGGNDYTTGDIQVFVRVNGDSLTLPVANKYHPEILQPKDKIPERIAGECSKKVASEPQLLITNNAVSTLMLNAFYAWSQGKFLDKPYTEAYVDILSNSARSSRKEN